MYTLYTIPGTCSTGIHTLLNQLNVPFNIALRDQVDNYSALVPTNQVPALKTEQTLLTEGSAIALHLLREHGDKTLTENPEFVQWLMFNYATLHPAYSKLFALKGIMDEGQTKQAGMQALADNVANLWKIVDGHLADREFMFGNTATLIDYLITVYVSWGNVFPELAIPVGSNVLALAERIKALPEFQKAYASEGAQYSVPDNALAA